MNQMYYGQMDMSSTHSMRKLGQIDMNLLISLHYLGEERSVTRAAVRAGVTQSAMSHTLNRLRETFDDDLLVRSRGSMQLTPRAEAIMGPLRHALAALAEAIAPPEPFDPAVARRDFRVSSPDLFDMLILPAVLAQLRVEAPGINLAVISVARLADGLEAGDIDLAIVPISRGRGGLDFGEPNPGGLARQLLFDDGFRCFVRPEHPAINKRRKLSLSSYTSHSHLVVSPTGSGPGIVDRALASKGLERRIALRVPQFATALAVVAQTDLLLTAPRSLARCGPELVSLAPPVKLPDHSITMVWHPRLDTDPAHRWFRGFMAEVASAAVGLRPNAGANQA